MKKTNKSVAFVLTLIVAASASAQSAKEYSCAELDLAQQRIDFDIEKSESMITEIDTQLKKLNKSIAQGSTFAVLSGATTALIRQTDAMLVLDSQKSATRK